MKHIYQLLLVMVCWAFATRHGYTQPCNPQLSYNIPNTVICIDSGELHPVSLHSTSQPSNPAPQWMISGPNGFEYGPVTGTNILFYAGSVGNYTITMLGDYGNNCKDTAIFANAFSVNQKPPTPCFYASDTVSCHPPLNVQFINCSTQPPGSTCTWNWGPNITPNTTTTCTPPTINYNSYGQYTVTLFIRTAEGCISSKTRNNYITIDTLHPTIWGYNMGCTPLNAQLISWPNPSPLPTTDYLWQIYNNGILIDAGQSNTYTRTFTQTGSYAARLTLNSGQGCTATAYKESAIVVSEQPICALTVSADTMCYGTPMVFSLNGTMCNYSSVNVHYGDEPLPNQATQIYSGTFDHLYNPGEYDAWILPVANGCYGDTQHTHIVIKGPKANFTSSTACTIADTVFFENTSLSANRYHWQFNCISDTFNTFSPRLALLHCDTCRVTLTAYNDTTGCTFTKQSLISTPCNGVEADFEYTSAGNLFCGTTNVTFINISQLADSGTTKWYFFNGSNTGKIVTHILPAGHNKVVMVYNAPGGCSDTVVKYIDICNLSCSFTPVGVCLPDSFHFRSTISNTGIYGCDSIVSYQWSANGSNFSTLPNPVQYFPLGHQQVTLTVTNAYGCTASITQNTGVKSEFNYDINIDTTLCPGAPLCIENNSSSPFQLTEIWDFPDGSPSTYNGHNPPCVTFTNEGSHLIYYHALSGTCTRYDSIRVSVHKPELCGYVSNNHFDCSTPPVIVCATNCSQYVDFNTDTFTWNFGNGIYVEENPCTLYNFPGCNSVTLSVVTNNGCTDTITVDTVCLDAPRVLWATASPTSVCYCTDTVHFEIATVEATHEMFLTGCNQGFDILNPITPGTVENPTILKFDRVYCLTAYCQPQLLLGNASGCQSLYNLPTIYIDTPTANFGISTALCSNNEVCFTDSSFNNVDPNGNNWLWNFGDANDTATSNLQNPCHTYSHPGTYTVTLIAKPNSKCSDTTSRTITILPSPVANFNYTLTDTCKQAYYCFTDASTPVANTTITNWKWCYNDTTCYNTGNSTCYGFATEGTYQVKLQVTDSRGCKADTTLDIIANSIHHIQAIADVTVTDSCFYSVICMTDLSTSESLVTNRLWYYISNVSTAPNKCFNVYNQGYYDIALLITDAAGCKDTFTTGAIANPLITNSAFSYSVSGNLVLFTNQSSDFDNLTWLFGDNTTASINNPDHVYATPGTYQVTLIAQNDNCIDSSTQSVIVTGAIEPVDTICGIVYTDVFGNGQYENNTDIPLSGRLVTAGTYSAVTNQAGYYEMRLPANNYQLQVQAAPNTVFTQPVAGYYTLTSIGSGQKICNYNFGLEDTKTAIDGPEKDIKLVVMPNPFSDYTTITINGEKGVYSFDLYNTIGGLITSQSIVTGQPLTLHRNNLPAGVYIYTISKNGQVKGRAKLIIE